MNTKFLFGLTLLLLIGAMPARAEEKIVRVDQCLQRVNLAPATNFVCALPKNPDNPNPKKTYSIRISKDLLVKQAQFRNFNDFESDRSLRYLVLPMKVSSKKSGALVIDCEKRSSFSVPFIFQYGNLSKGGYDRIISCSREPSKKQSKTASRNTTKKRT